MLTYLHVQNFALIRDVEIDFSDGLNILSGETGAGKSILMDSILMALGARPDTQMIRTNADWALIELVFQVEDESTREKLAEAGIRTEADGSLILSRRIVEGRSLCRVNGETVPARVLRDAAGLLISVYGQNDSRLLLDEEQHLKILDAFGSETVGAVKAEYLEAYRHYRELKNKVDSFGAESPEARARELDFLRFEIEEIEEGKLKEGEEAELLKEHSRLVHQEERISALSAASKALSEEAGPALSESSRLIKDAERYDPALSGVTEQLFNLEQLTQDLLGDLNTRLLSEESDEGRLQETEERLNVIDRLKHKYGGSEEKVLESLQEFRERFDALKHFEEEHEALEKELSGAREKLIASGDLLHAARVQAGEAFSKEMEKALPELNFNAVVFRTEVTETRRYTSSGCDEVRFMISLNPGEEVRPLSKIASGGELSRIMLAVKTLSANAEDAGTLLFDEVDAGVSGRTAMAVALKLGTLAKSHQILLISHLPQIVAAADHHFLIEKTVKEDQTETHVLPLSEEESEKELARLLAAGELTPLSLENAREMKARLRASLKD